VRISRPRLIDGIRTSVFRSRYQSRPSVSAESLIVTDVTETTGRFGSRIRSSFVPGIVSVSVAMAIGWMASAWINVETRARSPSARVDSAVLSVSPMRSAKSSAVAKSGHGFSASSADGFGCGQSK
jgi:hypothetical protein